MFHNATGLRAKGPSRIRATGKLAFLGAVSVATATAVVLLSERVMETESPLPPLTEATDAPVALVSDSPAAPDVAASASGATVRTVSDEEPNARLLTHIATRSRMLAERDGASRLKLPAKFTRMSRRAMQIAANEQRLLDARRLAFDSRQRDLRAKIDIVRDEIAGFDKQRLAKQKEIGLLKEELQALDKLHTKQLTNIARLLSLRRDETRALWDIGSLDAAVARSHLTIKDIEAQMHDERHNLVVEAEKEIRIIDMEIGDMIKSPEQLSEDLVAMATGIKPDATMR